MNFTDWTNSTRATELAEFQRAAHSNPRLLNYLAEYYSDYITNFLEIADHKFPVVVFPALPSQYESFDFATRSEQSRCDVDSTLHLLGQEYLEGLRVRDSGLYDGVMCSLVSLAVDDTISLSYAAGSYFDALRTCDILEFELLSELGQHPDISAPELWQCLERRRVIHELGDPIVSAAGRSAAIGISVLVVYRGDNGHNILLRSCSPKLAAEIRLFHTVPSGMFESFGLPRVPANPVRDTIIREYLEELFEAPDIEIDSQTSQIIHPAHTVLEKMLADGSATLAFTGLAVDLLKLRPEICTLLIVESREWGQVFIDKDVPNSITIDAHLDLNLSVNSIPLGRIFSIGLGSELKLPDGLVQPELFSPPGAACLHMGLETLARM